MTRFNLRIIWFTSLVLLILNINCEEIESPFLPTDVNIKEAWIDNQIDNDGDGYYSDAIIHYIINCNKHDLNCFIWLGYKSSSLTDSDTYYVCFQSTSFTIDMGEDQQRCFHFSTFVNELPRDHYDFLLEIFLTSNKEEPMDWRSKRNDEDLAGIPLEPAAVDSVIN